MKELREQEKEFEEELNLIAEAAVKYAQKEGISVITGSGHVLKIAKKEILQFPQAKDEDRNELEAYIKKAGIWDQVSGLSLSRLSKMVEEETFEKKIIDRLLKFGENTLKTSVTLTKKKVDEE
jgi:hypothetical protein